MAFNAGSVIVKIKGDIKDFKKSMNDARNETKSFSANAVAGSKAIVKSFAVVGVAAGFLGKKILDQAASFEQTQIAFRTMIGDAEEADKVLRELANFAARTPFTLPGVEASAKQLLAMGGNTTDLLPELKALGDVSAGLSVPLSRLALNFGQVRVQNKLTGRELRDFSVAGVPLVAELAKNLGVAEEEIAEMVSAGTIGFAEVSQAFQTMSGEGGKFQDLMAAQSETLIGQISNLEDAFSLLAREIGVELLPIAKTFVTFVLETVIPGIKSLSNFIRENREALIALAIGITAMMIPAFISWAIAAGVAAVATIAATWPLILLGVAVTGLAFLIIKNWDWIKQGTLDLWNFVKTTFINLKNFLSDIGSKISDAITKPFVDAFNKVKEIANKIKEKAKQISPFHRESPSLVDEVKSGLGIIKAEFNSLGKGISIKPIVGALAAVPATVNSGGNNSIVINMAGANIGNLQDANNIGEKMGDSIIRKLQKSVRF